MVKLFPVAGINILPKRPWEGKWPFESSDRLGDSRAVDIYMVEPCPGRLSITTILPFNRIREIHNDFTKTDLSLVGALQQHHGIHPGSRHGMDLYHHGRVLCH